jgi:hypothetical protein
MRFCTACRASNGLVAGQAEARSIVGSGRPGVGPFQSQTAEELTWCSGDSPITKSTKAPRAYALRAETRERSLDKRLGTRPYERLAADRQTCSPWGNGQVFDGVTFVSGYGHRAAKRDDESIWVTVKVPRSTPIWRFARPPNLRVPEAFGLNEFPVP